MNITVSVQCIFFSLIFSIAAFSQNNSESSITPYFSSVVVTNAEVSSRWYQSVLGVKFRNLNENVTRGSKIIVLSSENVLLELIEVKSPVLREDVLIEKPEQTLIVGFTKIGFRVSDLDVTMQKLKDLNVNFFGEIYTDPISSKRSFLVHDPDKNLIQFFE